MLTVNWTVLGYVVLLDLAMLLLVLAGARRVWRNPATGRRRGARRDSSPARSRRPCRILVPAHDEEAGILDTLSAPRSGSATRRWRSCSSTTAPPTAPSRWSPSAYALREVPPRPTADLPVDGEVLSVHRATTGDPLLRHPQDQRRPPSDALNAGSTWPATRWSA